MRGLQSPDTLRHGWRDSAKSLLHLAKQHLHLPFGASLPDRRRFVRIRTAVVSNHSRVSLIVEDDGRGLPAEGMGRLGQEPHLTDDQQAGLGLWIANCIAELHRGELTLGGREGGGTRATLTLPVARLEAE